MDQMAMADTPITEITPELLAGRLSLAFANWLSGEILQEKVKEFSGLTERAVAEYFANEDHGYVHSCAVYRQARQIVAKSPQMMRLVQERAYMTDKLIDQVMVWSAMLHDLMRFFGYGFDDHEEAGAALARAAFWTDAMAIEDKLTEVIILHDYLCPLANGEELPLLFFKNPLAEIFRLADKTSLPAVAEFDRWRVSVQRYGVRFFDPDLSDEARFDFQGEEKRFDQLTYLLLFFAIQPSDFYAREAAEIYQQWARGKTEALCRLMTVCREEGVSEKVILETVLRFHQHYQLPLPEGIEGMRIYQELHKGKT